MGRPSPNAWAAVLWAFVVALAVAEDAGLGGLQGDLLDRYGQSQSPASAYLGADAAEPGFSPSGLLDEEIEAAAEEAVVMALNKRDVIPSSSRPLMSADAQVQRPGPGFRAFNCI